MTFRLWAIAMIGICAVSAAQAQSLYNAPGQSNAGTVQPLNLRELMRQEQAAQARRQAQTPAQSAIPYAAMPGASRGASFLERRAALNQWRDQRNAQAWADQHRTRQYMVALADSPNPSTFGTGAAQIPQAPAPRAAAGQRPAAPAPAIQPMIYRGARDNEAIETPRRLFNIPD